MPNKKPKILLDFITNKDLLPFYEDIFNPKEEAKEKMKKRKNGQKDNVNEVVKWEFVSNIKENLNIYLLFNKLKVSGRERYFINDIPKFKERKDIKSKFVYHIINLFEENSELPNKLEMIHNNYREIPHVRELCMTVSWRLVMGLGYTNPMLETSLSLDFLTGIPYIPGSTVKGFFRSYLEVQGYDNNKIKEWFGTGKEGKDDGKRGKVVFLNAYPVEMKKGMLKLDVMTPHYGKYYKKKDWPHDSDKPNPIPFLSIGEDTPFIFRFVCKDDKESENIKELLTKALTTYGVGAKTAVGYGYFKEGGNQNNEGNSKKKH